MRIRQPNYTLLLVLLGLVAAPIAGACTPIVTLMFSFAGPSPLLYAAGFVAAVILPLVIILKCILFSRSVTYSRWRAAVQMFVANLFSTIVGVFYGAMLANGTGISLIAALVIPCLVFPFARRCYTLDGAGIRHSKQVVSILIMLVPGLFLSIILHLGLSDHRLDLSNVSNVRFYFAFKAMALFVSFCCAIAITVFMEAGIILKDEARKQPVANLRIFPAALRATVVALLIAAIIGAAFAIPMRLKNPRFLMPALQSTSALL